MPLPLIIVIILWILGLGLGSTVLLTLFGFFAGRIVSVGGMIESGKDSLSKFMAYKQKPSSYVHTQTNYTEIFDDITNPDWTGFKKIINFRHYYKSGKFKEESKNIQDSDVVFYLFDLEKALILKDKKDYEEDVLNEIILYRDYCKKYEKPLIAIGTHLDKIEGFNKKQLVPDSDLIKKIRKDSFIKKILTIVNDEICFVSLIDDYIEQSAAIILEKGKKNIE